MTEAKLLEGKAINGCHGKITPIPFHDVALVGFKDGRAVTITSVEPRVLLGALQDGVAPEDEYFCDPEEYFQSINQLEWHLYAAEDARKIWGATCFPFGNPER